MGGGAHLSSSSLLASYYSILPWDTLCMLIHPPPSLPSPSFPTPSLLIHSERQQRQQPRLSRIRDCNELILFSLQLHNCPGFIALIAAAVCSHTHPQILWALLAVLCFSLIRAFLHSFSAIFLLSRYIYSMFSLVCFLNLLWTQAKSEQWIILILDS